MGSGPKRPLGGGGDVGDLVAEDEDGAAVGVGESSLWNSFWLWQVGEPSARSSPKERAGVGGVGGGAVEVEVGSLQGGQCTSCSANQLPYTGSPAATVTTRPPMASNHAGYARRRCRGVGVDGDETPAGAVHVVEPPPVDARPAGTGARLASTRRRRRRPAMPGQVGHFGGLVG